MAVKLKEAGYKAADFAVLEKSRSVGGTWYCLRAIVLPVHCNALTTRLVNTYPGCQCDVPSPVYSYSFYNYPEWDSFYPNQPQILKYASPSIEF